VVERGAVGRQASWAGAGILPPASPRAAAHPLDQLRALSHQLHAQWSAELLAETSIDNGYRRCGGLYVARSRADAASLRAAMMTWEEEGIQVQPLDPRQLEQLEPALSGRSHATPILAACLLADECQLRNPHHLRALEAACRRRGVRLQSETAVQRFEIAGHRIAGVHAGSGVMRADRFCIASGAWTRQLLRTIGQPTSIIPVRGQMVLFQGPVGMISRIINEGTRYLVPRDDGHVLAGSTEEEVGFDCRTTETGVGELTGWAMGLVPALAQTQVQRSWAGLRPGSFDGFPYLGKIPGLENAFVAAGHFRNGLSLAPATAVVMSRLIRGEPPQIDLSPFRIGRG
jgi:glycine oxidase